MDRLKVLRARLAALAAEAETINASADLTDEQTERLNAIADEFAATKSKISALERTANLKAETSESTGRVTEPVAPKSEPRITGGAPVIESDPKRGFESVAEFGNVVAQACRPGARTTDERLRVGAAAATTYGSEGVGADGGYAVPPQFASDIWGLTFNVGSVLSLFNPTPTSSSAVSIATSEWTPWGASGVLAYWVNEAGAITQSKPALKNALVNLHKLAVLVPATEELLEDAPRLNNLLTVQAANAIRYKADDSLVNGDGNGKPLGILNAGCLVSQAKTSGQAADTFTAANAAQMIGRLPAGSFPRATWLVGPDTYQQIITMTLGDQPAFMPPNQAMTGAPYGTLLGRPIIISDVCQTVGDLGDVYLVDPAGYAAFTKAGGIKSSTSMHLFFDYDEMAFKWTFRLGGQPYLSAAVSPAKGSSTYSHFVALAARA